jgi:hypothetical protein
VREPAPDVTSERRVRVVAIGFDQLLERCAAVARLAHDLLSQLEGLRARARRGSTGAQLAGASLVRDYDTARGHDLVLRRRVELQDAKSRSTLERR